MAFRKRFFAILLSLALVLTFMPALVFAEGGAAGEGQYIDLNSSIQVQASSSNSAIVYFDSKKAGGYLFKGTSGNSEHARVFIYESCPIDPESDSDGWNRIQYEDFDGDEVYDEESGAQIGSNVNIDYPFYAEADKAYKIEIETTFDEETCTFTLSLEETDRAGMLSNGLIYSSHYNNNEDGKELAYDIVGYKGSETGELVIPGELNGHRVETVGDWAINGRFSSVSVGEGVERITNNGLIGGENLLTVALPSTLKDIYDSPFSRADSRQEVVFPNGSDIFTVSDNMLIKNSEKTLCFAFGSKKETVTVPDGIKEIDAYAFDTLQPKVIYLPKSVRDVFQMPGSLEEMHIGNANCTISYYGIPWSDSDGEKPVYTVKVYAPAGGSVEQYCKDNDITFIAEGDPYDPSEVNPMGDPFKLELGKLTSGSFITDDGEYQDFEFTVNEDGLYGLNMFFFNIIGYAGTEIPDMPNVYTYQLTDSDNNVINAVADTPVREDSTPGYLFYLKKGKTYNFRLTATEAAKNCRFSADDVEMYLFAAEPFTVNGEGWDSYVGYGNVQRMSKLFCFTASTDGKYTITRRNTSDYDEGDLTMYLYAADSNGVTLAGESKETFTADLKGGVTYYLAIILSGKEASACVTVTDPNGGNTPPVQPDPVTPVQPQPTPSVQPQPTPSVQPQPGTATQETPAIDTGTVQSVSGTTVKVTSASANTVSFTKAKKSAKAVTVPATVTLSDGETYKVTQIEANAFKGSNATSVTLSKNITTLKAKAFNGSKVKTVTVKTPSLTKKSVKNSLKGSKVTTVKVKVGSKSANKKAVAAYKKIFTKKIVGKKVTVK